MDRNDAPPEPTPSYDICYWVDNRDTIVDVAPGWENFARANQAERLAITHVIGRNLLSFVHGDVTQMYVRTLLQSARLLRRPMIRPYRCDSPDTKRFMEMRITLEDSGLLRWEHRTLRTEALQRRVSFAALPSGARLSALIRCSMCNRLKSGGNWQEPDQTPETEEPAEQPIPVIYGVCPSCLAQPGRRRNFG